MRKIAGPAILMTVGVLLLLQSLNIVGFERTWPAILLVIGVVKLLQSNASAAGHIERFGAVPPIAAVPPAAPPFPDPSAPPSSSSGEVRNV